MSCWFRPRAWSHTDQACVHSTSPQEGVEKMVACAPLPSICTAMKHFKSGVQRRQCRAIHPSFKRFRHDQYNKNRDLLHSASYDIQVKLFPYFHQRSESCNGPWRGRATTSQAVHTPQGRSPTGFGRCGRQRGGAACLLCALVLFRVQHRGIARNQRGDNSFVHFSLSLLPVTHMGSASGSVQGC